jgi:hypothetical protein
MLRYLLLGICFFAFSACSADPVLNLEELEANARGGDPQAIEQLVGLLASEEPGLSDRIYPMVVEIGASKMVINRFVNMSSPLWVRSRLLMPFRQSVRSWQTSRWNDAT